MVGVGRTASGTFSISVAATAGGRAFATSGFYAAGTVVSLTATPASGYTFAGWTVDGPAAGSANPFTLTMTANHTVVANFVPSSTLTPPPGSPLFFPETGRTVSGAFLSCWQAHELDLILSTSPEVGHVSQAAFSSYSANSEHQDMPNL